MRFLRPSVLKGCPEPRIHKAWHVDGGRGDEVVPGRQGVIAVPEEGNHEDNDGSKVRNLEEFVSEGAAMVSRIQMCVDQNSPNSAV